jgi:hypothetical protein
MSVEHGEDEMSEFNRLMTAFGVFVAIGAATAVKADNRNLNSSVKGTFPFNETIIAGIASVDQTTGKCPNLLPSYPNVFQQLSLTNQGTWSFDGAGHVHMDDTGVQVVVPGAGSPANTTYSEAHCDGTYDVKPDSTIAFHYYCSVPAGPGNYITFDVHAKGVISKTMIQVAVPSAGPNQLQVTPVYTGPNVSSLDGATLYGCSVVGENTTIAYWTGQSDK